MATCRFRSCISSPTGLDGCLVAMSPSQTVAQPVTNRRWLSPIHALLRTACLMLCPPALSCACGAEDEARWFFQQLAVGLAYFHNLGELQCFMCAANAVIWAAGSFRGQPGKLVSAACVGPGLHPQPW